MTSRIAVRFTKSRRRSVSISTTQEKAPPYEFDAALSFAGEDRKHASRLARALKVRGYRIFYDKDFRGELWGKRQSEYEQIYGPRSRFVIPIVSENYTRKDWTLFEFESAKREAKNRDVDFLLPVRLDNARLLGLSDDVNYLRLGDLTVSEIASEFARKCGPPLGGSKEPLRSQAGRPPSTKNLALLLSSEARSVLGILVTAVVPLPIAIYRRVFPGLNWTTHCRRFSEGGLLRISNDRISVTQSAKECFADRSETTGLHERWIAAIMPVRWHVDTAVLLAMHYLSARSLDEAVNTIADVVETTSLGDWNQVYLAALQPLTHKRATRKMTTETRSRLFNALGICLSNAGEDEQALMWFEKLGATSQRAQQISWIGQSFLNRGVAFFNLGDQARAALYYRKAILHGEEASDDVLISRAKGNLAQLIRATSPLEAAELLSDSLNRKKAQGDQAGLAIVYGQLGQLKALVGETREAIEYFTKARTIAQRLGMRETLCSTFHDLGTAFSSLGRPSAALKYYKRAHRLAAQDGYTRTQILAGISEGRLCFELRRYEESLSVFRGLIGLAESVNDRVGLICSLHAVGVILRLRGRSQAGCDRLAQAQRLARSAQESEWTARCVTDECRRVVRGEFSGFDRPALRRAAILERKRRNWASAGRIWEIYAHDSCQVGADKSAIRHAFVYAGECYEKAGGHAAKHIEVLTRLYLWLWQGHEYTEAIKVLERAESVGRSAHLPEMVAQVVDQRGVCLQHISQYGRAKRDHLRALRIARQNHNEEQIGISLNNLGEALRKLGNHGGAVSAFEEAQSVSLGSRNFAGAITAAENRAVVFMAQGDTQGAAKLIGWCRRLAVKWRLWDAAVVAMARLAQLAWDQNNVRSARQHFHRALTEAKRYNQKESGHRIALNYSRLLLSQGEASLGLSVLKPWAEEFSKKPDAYLCHYTLGEIYKETKDINSATKHWRLGQSSAKGAGDEDYVAMCSAQLAEVYEGNGQLSAAEHEIRVALLHEPETKGRALLLIQLLRIQLAARKPKAAEKTFAEVRDIATKERLHTVTVDVHVMMGDYCWRQSKAEQFEALKAYTVAMVTALESDPDTYGHVLAHFVGVVIQPQFAPSQRSLARLAERLKHWATRHITNEPKSLSFVMWPVTLTMKLEPLMGDRRKLADELSRLVESGEFLPSLK